jgi:glycosyltransferase involved in cell wall biosynthesis
MGAILDHVPVSIVIPAFNEARRLPESLPRLVAMARKLAGAEIILVDDGSTDGTAELARRLLRELPKAHVVQLPWNSGKGTAIRVGVAMARGEAIVFMDADMASDVNDLPLLLAALSEAEVVLGSRRLGDGATRSQGRRMGSWAFNQVTRTLASLDFADTQCGFKAFRHREAKVLFSLARATGFGFDVEVLSIARAMGYRVVEVPVRWSEVAGGTFRVSRHTPAMLVDVVRARRHLRRIGPALPATLLPTPDAVAESARRAATAAVTAGSNGRVLSFGGAMSNATTTNGAVPSTLSGGVPAGRDTGPRAAPREVV